MSDHNHLSGEDLALFALQLLPEEEMAAALKHLRGCDACLEEAAQIQGELAAYALTADVQAPPARARERLLGGISKEKRPIAIDRPDATAIRPPLAAVRSSVPLQSLSSDDEENAVAPRSRATAALAWTGWAIAAGLGVVAALQYQQRETAQNSLAAASAQLQQSSSQLQQSTAEAARAQAVMQTLTDASAMQVALHLPATPGTPPKPEAHAAYVANRGALVLVASNLHPLKAGKTYELWLLPAAAGRAPIPAGLFKPDASGNASVVLPDLPKGVAAKGFGVTIEAAGGAHSPTPPIVLAGL